MKQLMYYVFTVYIPTFISLLLLLISINYGILAFAIYWLVPLCIINIYSLYLLHNGSFIDSVKGDMKFLFWYFVVIGSMPFINLIAIQFFMINLFFERVGLFESIKDR